MQCLYIPSFYYLVVSTPSPSHLLQSKKLRMFIVIWKVSHAWCLYTCIHIPPPLLFFFLLSSPPIWCVCAFIFAGSWRGQSGVVKEGGWPWRRSRGQLLRVGYPTDLLNWDVKMQNFCLFGSCFIISNAPDTYDFFYDLVAGLEQKRSCIWFLGTSSLKCWPI